MPINQRRRVPRNKVLPRVVAKSYGIEEEQVEEEESKGMFLALLALAEGAVWIMLSKQ